MKNSAETCNYRNVHHITFLMSVNKPQFGVLVFCLKFKDYHTLEYIPRLGEDFGLKIDV